MTIVDVHCHALDPARHLSAEFRSQARRARSHGVDLAARLEDYRAGAPEDVRTVVFGGKARLSGIWVDDEHVAAFVRQDAHRFIGFCAVDPTQPGWESELRRGHAELGLRGVKLMPMYAGFDPGSQELEPLWTYLVEHGLPCLLHTGTTFVSRAPLEYARPMLVDRVARWHPDLTMVLAHLGHPFEGECVAVIRKHANVYADLSALHYRPFQLYHSLMLVQEYGVWDKVLFGSDFPFTTVNESVAGLRALNRLVEGTQLPRLDEQAIDAVLNRDSLHVLGLG